MGIKHYTALGEPIDMSALAARHSSTVALGNAKMNARGDVVGQGGIVLKTQEQIEEEWRRLRQTDNVVESVVDIKTTTIPSPHSPKKIIADDSDFSPEPSVDTAESTAPTVSQTSTPNTTRRRKIVDSAE